jgi:hypothetical protein
MYLALCHPHGAENLEMASKFLENLSIIGLGKYCLNNQLLVSCFSYKFITALLKKIFRVFMEFVSSSPCWQQRDTPILKLIQSAVPHPVDLVYYYPCIHIYVFIMISFFGGYPTNFLRASCSSPVHATSPCVSHAPRILSPKQHSVKSKNSEKL